MDNHKIISVLLIVTLLTITLTVAFSASWLNYSSEFVNTTGSMVIGSSDNGDVTKYGPFGNCESSVKIAYIVGVHPLENRSHTAMVSALTEHENSLRYCYYIYQVNVT